MAAPTLEVSSLDASYQRQGQSALEAVSNLSLHVEHGEFVAVVGPSGCGKSTLLAVIAGLLEPIQGSISLDGDERAKRLGSVGLMPQNDLLMPWRRVLDNVTLGLESRGTSKAEARVTARTWLAQFGLDEFANVWPDQLSTGMRQRVALLRTLLPEPELVLLDEPFAALDALTRREMWTWLEEARQRSNASMLLVTHDVQEAIYLADRVLVMTPRPGSIRLDLTVNLPRPRGLETVSDPAFTALERSLLEVLLDP